MTINEIYNIFANDLITEFLVEDGFYNFLEDKEKAIKASARWKLPTASKDEGLSD